MVSQVVILVGFVSNGRGCFQRDAARTGTCRECPREAFRCVVRENHDPVYVRVDPQAGLRAVDCGGVTEPGPVGGPARPRACAARSGIRRGPGDDRAPRLSARDGESGAGHQCRKSRELPAAGCASTSGGSAHPSVLRWTMECASNHVDAGPAATLRWLPPSSFQRPHTNRSAPIVCGVSAGRACCLPGLQTNRTGVTMRSPSTAISRPGGCVEIAVAVGGSSYRLAAPSMSPADNRSDPTGIPGGDRSDSSVMHDGSAVARPPRGPAGTIRTL